MDSSPTQSVCPNCGSKITCGCQKRRATDGTPCCAKCVAGVNCKIARAKRNQSL